MIPGYLLAAGSYVDLVIGIALLLAFVWAVKPARRI